MNDTLLILGNGFDLSLGLKTSYGDFMKSSYFEDFAEKTFLGKYLRNEQFRCYSWIDIEKALSKYCLEINSGGLMTPMKQYGPACLYQEHELLKEALKGYLCEEQKNLTRSKLDFD